MPSFPPLSFVCPIRWDDMRGDERARFCAKCSRSVVNLSLLTTAQRETLLAQTDPRDLCVAYYQRLSGEFVTAEQPLTASESSRVVQLGVTALSIGAAALAFHYAPSLGDAVVDHQPHVASQVATIGQEVSDRANAIIDQVGKQFGRKRPPVVLMVGAICDPAFLPRPLPTSALAPTPAPALTTTLSPSSSALPASP